MQTGFVSLDVFEQSDLKIFDCVNGFFITDDLSVGDNQFGFLLKGANDVDLIGDFLTFWSDLSRKFYFTTPKSAPTTGTAKPC